ncbi:MAG: hypothetical protein MZW92_72575 [Comamonadaceae bacterium]|nr:hypothetical protein [Comamonadaceae bacterium]
MDRNGGGDDVRLFVELKGASGHRDAFHDDDDFAEKIRPVHIGISDGFFGLGPESDPAVRGPAFDLDHGLRLAFLAGPVNKPVRADRFARSFDIKIISPAGDFHEGDVFRNVHLLLGQGFCLRADDRRPVGPLDNEEGDEADQDDNRPGQKDAETGRRPLPRCSLAHGFSHAGFRPSSPR